jgi:hypothetical protein
VARLAAEHTGVADDEVGAGRIRRARVRPAATARAVAVVIVLVVQRPDRQRARVVQIGELAPASVELAA